ncbi:PorP/SprF family type IX secretion system membrane protein [Filimonas effusa]|uniref:Type IX secretion system membrane protein PorP/SprF n=1 Tax=Filimonas effusa TaxID=2508721 RepID=A0A4Q1D3F3_9BACT|nr:PorP/SprF family type IX secretion system membrane protein [Filimonas effusa]RXK82828.1 type IX secretion system membrane protein PorP/SprF [Filimonas effusa]
MPSSSHWKKAAFALVAAMTFVLSAGAQDLHFSQYFNSPLLVNPANTGFAPDVDWRAGINYRNQWSNITNNPYKTMSAWGDMQLFNDRFESGWLGVGGSLLRDVAGSGNLTSTKIYGSVAYHQMLGLASLLSAGFSGGWVNKRVDLSKLTFDNQWNGDFFDITLPNNEPFAYSAVGYFDLNVGMNYAYFPNDKVYLNAGASVMHLNRPKESFFSATSVDAQLNMRYNFFVNAAVKLNDKWIINPNVYYSRMTNATEVVLGLNANYNLSGDGSAQLIGGLYYRKDEAFIPMAGYQWNDLKLTINYDATTSSLKSYNQTKGAYEFSLVKTGLFNATKPIKCPTVKF